MLFNTTKKILNERKDGGILTAIVSGRFGVGKSMYCIKTAYQLYRELGYNEDDGWRLALNAVVFKPEEFSCKLKSGFSDIIIMDDASVHVGSDLYLRNNKMHTAYRQALTTIRTKTNAMLYNCPNPEELSKFVRESDAYQIYITKNYGYDRYATGYGWRRFNTRVGPQRRLMKSWVDRYSCYIPKRVYTEYLKKREKYLDKPIEVLGSSEYD